MALRPAACVVLLLAALTACGGTGGATGSETDRSAEATATETACPAKSRCFDFTQDSDGWPDISDESHYAARDSYLEGTYRIGARTEGSWTILSPVKASSLSTGYGVRLEADAVIGQNFPDTAAWGATCWTRPLVDDRVAGFAVLVQPTHVTLGLYDETGELQPLREVDAVRLFKPGQKVRLTLSCREDTTKKPLQARIDAAVNGSAVLGVTYADSRRHFGWSPADGTGLLVSGDDSDVFFDRVVITGLT